jgi:hypothetical protein
MNRQPSAFTRVEIPVPKVLARLGYARGITLLDERTRTLLDDEIALAGRLIQPRVATAESPVRFSAGAVVALEPALAIASTSIAELLAGCAVAAGFAVTIGSALEEKRDEYLAARETTRAAVLDAIGSVVADELAAAAHHAIAGASAQKGLAPTRRFSPGYGDWQLAGQRDFLAWLAADRIGIRLTDHYQMLPEKSVSALLGLFPAGTTKK